MKLRVKPLVMAMLLASPVMAQGLDNISPAQQLQTEQAIEAEQNKQNALLKTVNRKASEALELTAQAIEQIRQGNIDEAKNSLKLAYSKLNLALAANPGLKRVPVASSVTRYVLATAVDAVKAQVTLAKDALDKGDIQLARQLLTPLRDELAITTNYLPLGSYPKALDKAIKALVQEQPEQALAILEGALTTVVSEEVALPLSLIRIKSLLQQVADLKAKKEADREQMAALVEAAKVQLQLAQSLGYAYSYHQAYSRLNKQLAELASAIAADQETSGWLERLQSGVDNLLGKLKAESEKDTD